MRIFRIAFVWLLVLALVVAPLMPAVAASAQGSDTGGPQQHAGHAAMDSSQHDAVFSHDAGGVPANDVDCTKHDACDGKCCNACAHCFAVTVVFRADSDPLHSVQTPVIPRLHARLAVALPNRPPQTL